MNTATHTPGPSSYHTLIIELGWLVERMDSASARADAQAYVAELERMMDNVIAVVRAVDRSVLALMHQPVGRSAVEVVAISTEVWNRVRAVIAGEHD